MAAPVPGAPILSLNRDMRCQTQCERKTAARQQERGTRYPGGVTHLEAQQGLTWKEIISMSFVLVIDQDKQPCQPVHPGQARRLLCAGKAVIYRRFPFVIRLKAVQ